jgi:hypothetical protein
VSPILGIYASQISGHLYANSYDALGVVTVGAGGASSIDFTSISSAYTHLQIRVVARSDFSGGASASFQMQFNGDTSTNYTRHFIFGDGSTASSGNALSQTLLNIGDAPTPSGGSNLFGTSVVDILDYANTNKYKTIRSLSGNDMNGSGIVRLLSGLWLNTNAITSIKFIMGGSSNYTQYSQIALYGIK